MWLWPVEYKHLRGNEDVIELVCRRKLERKKVKTPIPSKSSAKIPEEIITNRLENWLAFDTVSDNAINLSSLDSKESVLSVESRRSFSLLATGFFSFASVVFLSFVAMFSTQAITTL